MAHDEKQHVQQRVAQEGQSQTARPVLSARTISLRNFICLLFLIFRNKSMKTLKLRL